MIELALVTSTYENVYSGVGTYAQMLVKGLQDAKIKFCVISPDCHHAPPFFIKTPLKGYDISPNKWLSNAFSFKKVLSELSGQLKMVHFIDAREALFAVKRKGVKFIGSVHDTYSFDLQSQELLKRHFIDWKKRLVYYYLLYKCEKKSYSKLDFVISNTNFVKGRLADFYDIASDRIETVYIGSPLKKLNNRKVLGDTCVVSFIGGNFQRKGLIPLAQAVKKLKQEGISIKLIVAGRDNNESEIRRKLEQDGCGDVIHFYGYLPPQNIPSFLMSSHIFAMPSYVEAYGLVYLEAMACGVPVLGTSIGGTKEMIQDGINGFLCNPFDINEIADRLKRLLNPVTRERIIEKGYETVDRFTVEASISKTIEIYQRIKVS